MRQFVITHHVILGIISFILYAFSLLFGGQVLGRFPALNREGIFKRWMLVAIPTGVVLGVAYYGYDVLSSESITMALHQVLRIPLQSWQTAVIVGTILGVLPYILLFTIQHLRVSQNTSPQEDSKGTPSLILTLFALLATKYAAYLVTEVPVAYFIFEVLGLFGGTRTPPSVFVFGAPALLLLSEYMAITLGWIADHAEPTPSQEEVEAQAAKFAEKISQMASVREILVASRQEQRRVSKPFRVSERKHRNAARGYALEVLCQVGLIILPYSALLLYSGLKLGWIVLIFVLFVVVGEAAIGSLRVLANRLSVRALTIIFAAPGVIATVLQFAINYETLLPK